MGAQSSGSNNTRLLSDTQTSIQECATVLRIPDMRKRNRHTWNRPCQQLKWDC